MSVYLNDVYKIRLLIYNVGIKKDTEAEDLIVLAPASDRVVWIFISVN